MSAKTTPAHRSVELVAVQIIPILVARDTDGNLEPLVVDRPVELTSKQWRDDPGAVLARAMEQLENDINAV